MKMIGYRCLYCGHESNSMKEAKIHKNHCAREHGDSRYCVMCGVMLDDYDHENTCIKCN